MILLRRILHLLFLFPLSFFAQEKAQTVEIVINDVPAKVEVTESKRKTNSKKRYFWFDNQHIVSTQGDYGGKLLHGKYMEYYSTGQLKLKGEFRYGIQQGVWKYWDAKGNLERIERWKNNELHGKTIVFNGNGEVQKIIWYKSGEVVKEKECLCDAE